MQDPVRINALIDAAARNYGQSDNQLAMALGTSRQVLSNWRHGHKSPSIEVQAELAAMGGCSVPIVTLTAMIESAKSPRRERLQQALREWAKDQDAAKARQVPWDWAKALEPKDEALEQGGLVPANWRKKADVIKGRVESVGKS